MSTWINSDIMTARSVQEAVVDGVDPNGGWSQPSQWRASHGVTLPSHTGRQDDRQLVEAMITRLQFPVLHVWTNAEGNRKGPF